MSKWFSLFITTIILIGCASSPQKEASSQKNLSDAEIEQMNKEAVARVSQRLEELSIAAKAQGPDKVRFLANDMYLKASAAIMEGDYQTANVIFKHLISLDPKDDFIKQKYAISLIRTGELEEAKTLLEEVFAHSKNKDERIGLVLAGVYGSLGEIQDSRKTYQAVLKAHPKSEEACIFLSKSYALEKKTSKAITLLKKCEKDNKGKGIYSYYIGKIFVESKKYTSAKTYFEKSVKLQPDFSQGILALGLIYEELGRFTQAKKTYKKYLKSKPQDTMVLSRLVQLMFTQEEFTEVIQYAEMLSDYEPDNLNLRVKLGILYTDIQEYEKAIRTFKNLLVHAPDNDKILYYLGAIYQEMKSYDNSIEYFAKIDEKSGLYQDSSLQIAQMLSKLAVNEFNNDQSRGDQHDKFVDYIDQKIEELKTFTVEFSVIKASYFETLDDNDEAIDVLEVVRGNKSFNDDHKFYLATLYEKEKAFNKSTEIIEQIIEYNPKNAHAWNFLGYSLVERGVELDDAYEYLQRAITLSPEDGYIRDSLGWYYYKRGHIDKALVELNAAIKSVPHDVSINKHLAVVHSSKKDFTKAKFYIKKALKEASSTKEVAELNSVLKELEQDRIPASFKEIVPQN
ncbi:MAG: hypothetical protein CME62_13010 [Halobacteriovoraceae bacterium]|nr:hypothetical protein [Halobacteriovoraceae bacterium]|tara:strand:+ start:342 stop:2213 length:1872 start_codon:yes stop_codon:yes gene_type:complete